MWVLWNWFHPFENIVTVWCSYSKADSLSLLFYFDLSFNCLHKLRVVIILWNVCPSAGGDCLPSLCCLTGDWILYIYTNSFSVMLQSQIKVKLVEVKGVCCRVIEWIGRDVCLILWIVFSHFQILPDRAIEAGSKFWQRDRNCYFWNGPFTMFDVHLKQFGPADENVVSVSQF